MLKEKVIVSGCLGLIGSYTTRRLLKEGYFVIGIDNDLRKKTFGEEGSTSSTLDEFIENRSFEFHATDLVNFDAVSLIVENNSANLLGCVHTTSLPAHQSCDSDPMNAYDNNVTATMNLLNASDFYAKNSKFIFMSSSKVYGNDHSTAWEYEETKTRYDLPRGHAFWNGITENYNPDGMGNRSLLGSTKLAADVLCQEFSTRNLDISIFRPGCLTGPGHRGVEAHGFLAYLTKCAVFRNKYLVHGYKGKQVRDSWHAEDVAEAILLELKAKNKSTLNIFNIGGSRESNCSVLEAIKICEEILGKEMNYEVLLPTRNHDHKWFIGSDAAFIEKHPNYKRKYSVEETIRQLILFWQEEKKKPSQPDTKTRKTINRKNETFTKLVDS